jgi:hypothetical protein
MLMVVFGAGASRDAIHPEFGGNVNQFVGNTYNYYLPLARELFDRRENFNAIIGELDAAQPIIDRLRRHVQVGGQVEQELERLKADGDPRRARQLSAIRYYLQAAIDECGRKCLERSAGVTNYVTLLERIEEWRRRAGEKVCLVTFNYDQLLDRACEATIGMDTTTMGGYVTDDWMLIKLHGSVNWGRPVRSRIDIVGKSWRQIRQEFINVAGHLEVAPHWEVINGPPEHLILGRRPDQLLYPAIAIPVEAKPDFECPDEHVRALKEVIGLGVERLLVIRWRASEQRFLDMLRERKPLMAMIVTADASSGAEPAKNLESAVLGARGDIVVGGFSDFSTSGALDRMFKWPVDRLNPPTG